MPEILEAETARALIAQRALGREVSAVDAPDAWFLKRGLTPSAARAALVGVTFTEARRRGKLLLLDTGDAGSDPASDSGRDAGATLALHLGMSGRIVIDGEAAGDPLRYAANGDNPDWYRFGVRFTDGGSLRLRDPRRLGGVELDPDEDRLGPDAFTVSRAELDRVLTASRAPVKAVLMNQQRIAGLGNLLTDEVLWRAGIDPARRADSLDAEERRVLQRTIRRTLVTLGRRGGSHTGDHMTARMPGGVCPKDGTELTRRTVAGRTTYSCPTHQR